MTTRAITEGKAKGDGVLMGVPNFTEGMSPADSNAAIWRFMELWKFRDLLESGRLYFRRADRLEDDHEGMPPEQWMCTALDYNKYDLRDIHKLDHDLGSLAQFRQSYYLNCWYLFDEERAGMWSKYGHDGVAIVSTYALLGHVLEPLVDDNPHLGLVRYGWAHGTRYNTQRFITTKRLDYESEREIRAALWLLNTGDGMNRHFDLNNKPHGGQFTTRQQRCQRGSPDR